MSSERWERVAQLYELALAQPPGERELFLASACAGDEELRREVNSLLSQDVAADGLIERVAASAEGMWPSPATIGRYRILRFVGEGGMGAVYEAEQDHPRRIVALKVVKSPLASPDLQRRLARESEILGRLQHPGIARIYDAGMVANGWGRQPYLVMEFIRGVPLTRYAHQHGLDLRRRLELMIRVCDAVAHAHERGIIHRDLKPGNILIELDGQPKVLDFGVARILEGGVNASFQTQPGDIVGTLTYMSPEQLLGDPTHVDARSDVYSLGVLLFELLTGRLPYAVGHNIADAARTIRDEEPASLGTAHRSYRGDLETIVGKAIDKNKALRYASAGALADDLRRYLEARPIVAVKPTAAYLARKFVSRHRGLVTAAGSVFLVLLLGIAASTFEATRAIRERDRARRAEEIAATVNTFLREDLLAQAGARSQADARNRPDPNLTVRTALDRAASHISERFESQPQVEAAIRRTIGLAYYDLTLFPEAQMQLERAADLRRRVLGPLHPDTLTSLDELGVLYNYQSKYADAKALLSTVLETRRRVLGRDHPDTLATMSHFALAVSYSGDDVRATDLFEALYETERRVHGDEHPDTLEVMDDLATTKARIGKSADGAALLAHEIDISRRVRGPEHPDTVNAIHNLATTYRRLGRYAEADALFQEALAARLRALGEDQWETQNTRFSMAISYRAQGRYADANLCSSRRSRDSRGSCRAIIPSHCRPDTTLGRCIVVNEDFTKRRSC